MVGCAVEETHAPPPEIAVTAAPLPTLPADTPTPEVTIAEPTAGAAPISDTTGPDASVSKATVKDAVPAQPSFREINFTGVTTLTNKPSQVQVVFVLDFTNSMAQASLSDGTSGIDAMIEAFEASGCYPV